MTSGGAEPIEDPVARLQRAEADLHELRVAYEARNRQLAVQRARLIAELEEEHELRAGFRTAIGEAQQQAALAEAKAEERRHDVLNREEQIAALQAHVAMLDRRVADRDAELSELRRTRDELQHHLDAVFNSKTMRALRPGRAVYKRFRHRSA